jgi:hypothetical protein
VRAVRGLGTNGWPKSCPRRAAGEPLVTQAGRQVGEGTSPKERLNQALRAMGESDMVELAEVLRRYRPDSRERCWARMLPSSQTNF